MKNPQRHGDIHRRKLNNCINQLYERALRLLYKDKNATYDELLQKGNSISVYYRNLQFLATELFKVKIDIAPNIMKEVFQFREPLSSLRSDMSAFMT